MVKRCITELLRANTSFREIAEMINTHNSIVLDELDLPSSNIKDQIDNAINLLGEYYKEQKMHGREYSQEDWDWLTLPDQEDHVFNNVYIETTKELPIQAKLQAKKSSKSGETKERNSLYRIALGVALEKYQYDPSLHKNKSTGEKAESISDDLSKYGIEITGETIKKYLKRAAEEINYKYPAEE